MKNTIEERLKKNAAAGDEGFSLIELVVAVGIMLTLTVSSLTACVKDIRENIENDATESAVKVVYAEAFQNVRGFDESYTEQSAVENWNNGDQSFNVEMSSGVVYDEDGSLPCIWVKGVNDNGFTYVHSTNDECSDQ